MNQKLIILSYFLLGLCCISFAQHNKIDTRSANRRFADSMYAVNSGRMSKSDTKGNTLSKKTESFTDTIKTTSLNYSILTEQEDCEKEIVIEFRDAPCKTLYNNTWCTNKVKMPSFRFGEFPDEFKIRLIDHKKEQGFHFPCKNGRKSSHYGWRWGRPHGGIDFAIDVGEPIYAVFDGVIRVAQVNGGYGKMVLIRHYNNLETLYGHLNEIKVKVGQIVKAGDVIGYSGNTGFSTGPHLHFECRCLYQTFDPEWILDVENRTLKTDRINIEKTFFGIERAEKQINKRQPLTSLSKVHTTFEGKPYYSFKEKYRPQAEVRYLAKGGNQPVKKLIEINHEDKSTWRYWRVRKGDTITKLADRFNVTPRQIIEMNSLKDEVLKPNTKIRVR
jgi:murein DD-endopeptidase MepM/ murein hydrolase activator NlpD